LSDCYEYELFRSDRAKALMDEAGFSTLLKRVLVWPLPTFCTSSRPLHSLLSAGASPAAPLGGIWQCEQVQTSGHQHDEREQRQETHPDGLFLPDQRREVDDDGHRKGNGQPTVKLPNPRVPIQWDLL
jgi:hypothetical protein